MNLRVFALLAVSLVVVCGSGHWTTLAQSPAAVSSDTPHFTQDGKLEFPADYREWIYLTSGLNMSYAPRMGMNHDMFDNVFVNPSAYKAFLETGTWPDQTMLVLEVRGAGSKASINKSGHFQNGDVMGREVHLKDKRVPGGWAFYGFDETKPTTPFPHGMDCYSCHEQHGAVDTTFVQFYPTLIKLAEEKGTLSAGYKKEEAKK
ncbi:MAG TPA: cytochrome P460 family protein [Candidatus Eisenbacteria bacterium]|nr:cytochrome P460 family protein [Candidatus Eisenbacteria bacterium]